MKPVDVLKEQRRKAEQHNVARVIAQRDKLMELQSEIHELLMPTLIAQLRDSHWWTHAELCGIWPRQHAVLHLDGHEYTEHGHGHGGGGLRSFSLYLRDDGALLYKDSHAEKRRIVWKDGFRGPKLSFHEWKCIHKMLAWAVKYYS